MSYYGPSSPSPEQPGPHQAGSYGWQPQGGQPQSSQYSQYGGQQPYVVVSQPGTLPLRPLMLGDYFSSMFATIRKSPGLFFGAALIFGSFSAIVSATGAFFMLRIFDSSMTDPYSQLDQLFSGATFGVLAAGMLSQLVLVLGQLFNWGMYSAMVSRGSVGMKTSLGQGFRLLRGQWGRLIGLVALLIAAVVVFTVLTVLLIALTATVAFAGGEPASGGAIAATILAFLAALLLPILVAVFFMVRLHLVIPAIVVEDIGLVAGLRRSWQLTRGYFWRTLAIALLFGLILGFVSVIITSPLSFISSFILAAAGTEAQLLGSMMVLYILITAVSSLVSFIVTNMSMLVSIFFYFDYRFRKEGLGLQFQQIAAQQDSGSNTDRFDTSMEDGLSTPDKANDLIPGRNIPPVQQAGQQYGYPGPSPQQGGYGQYGPGGYQQPGSQPPNPPGPGS